MVASKFLAADGESDPTTVTTQLKAIGVGTAAPTDGIYVGASGKLQIDVNGNIIRINNVATSFPASQGTAGQTLINNGSGVLTWTSVPTGSGTTGKLPKWTGTAVLGDSILSESGGALIVSGLTAGVGHLSAGGQLSSSAVVLTSEVSGVLPVANGGTGISSTTTWGVIYATAGALASTAAGTTGQVLTANSGGAPTWTTVSGTISGLTTNYVAKASSATTIANSQIFDNGTNVGIGTATPSTILAFSGDAARTVQMERHGTIDTTGNNLTIVAGSTKSGSLDKDGGDLVLSGGIATGANSSNILLQTATAGGSGTTDRTPTTKYKVYGTGNLEMQGNYDFVPATDDTGHLGTDLKRWNRVRANNVMTGDLDMKAPDGSAHWKLVERPDGIYAINMLTGKRYSINLTLVED